jgi:PEP-CTERM motif
MDPGEFNCMKKCSAVLVIVLVLSVAGVVHADSTVPEPTTMLLLCFGLVVLARGLWFCRADRVEEI